MNIEYSKIKIVIWDLDDTFWRGTLSEEGIIPIELNIQLIKDLTDRGVVNSICSKNDFEKVRAKLIELDIFDFFIFPSVDWSPKGQRIASILNEAGLRPANCLFLDDNIINLNEALHYTSEELMVGSDEAIEILRIMVDSYKPSDKDHNRLKQYKILEEKNKEKNLFSNNEEFLFKSNIIVDFRKDCKENLDRIVDLVQRSNQLNYTKLRWGKNEFYNYFNDPDNSDDFGYITVKDRFGDYGIIGFYAISINDAGENFCKHLLFSCRTIGQGVEQYVYAKLNYPQLQVVGDIVSSLSNDPAPKWINNSNKANDLFEEKTCENNYSVLFKGPCDLLGMMNYVNNKSHFDTEFTYIGSKNNVIETHNHSSSIVGLHKYSDIIKRELINDCLFLDETYFKSSMFLKNYDLIFLSSLMEPNIAQYRKKGTDVIISFAESIYPITDATNWDKYIDSKIYNGQNNFNREQLEHFSQNYEFIGKSTPSQYIERLKYVLTHLNAKTKICIILGSELEYEKNNLEAYSSRHLEHKLFNEAIRNFACKESRVCLLDVNKFVKSQKDYFFNINHFTPQIYYLMAQEVNKIIYSYDSNKVRSLAKAIVKLKILLDYYNMYLHKIGRSFISENSLFFRFFQKIYRKIKI